MAYTGNNTVHPGFNWNPAYDNYIHVALWGNDTIGTGTKFKPYRTIGKAISVDPNWATIVIGSGVYREKNDVNYNGGRLVADGEVIIDVSNDPFLKYMGYGVVYSGLKFRGTGSSPISNSNSQARAMPFHNCEFDGVLIQGNSHTADVRNSTIVNCIFKNIICSNFNFTGDNGASIKNCTFYNFSGTIQIYAASDQGPVWNGVVENNIFSNINGGVNFSTLGTFNNKIKNCNFYNTKINNQTFTNNQDLNIWWLANSTGAIRGLDQIYFEDPKFNNVSIGDLTLSLDSKCKNMSFYGDLIGASPIGFSITCSQIGVNSGFDNDSISNLIIGNNGNLTLSSITENGGATTKPITNLSGRFIKSLSTYGTFADRNGEYIDSTPDLDLSGTYAAGDVLGGDVSNPRVYMVEDGAIFLGGNTLQPGDRFVIDSLTNTFTTSATPAGIVREIIEAPTRFNIEVRVSNGMNLISSGSIIAGEWYAVEGNPGQTITYNGHEYLPFQDGFSSTFKGITGVTTFTGTGVVRKIFDDTIPYHYYQTTGQPTCNRAGDLPTGAILKGNGARDFDSTPAKVFKLSEKYIQVRYVLQVNNLRP